MCWAKRSQKALGDVSQVERMAVKGSERDNYQGQTWEEEHKSTSALVNKFICIFVFFLKIPIHKKISYFVLSFLVWLTSLSMITQVQKHRKQIYMAVKGKNRGVDQSLGLT